MKTSISHLLKYNRKENGGTDWIGGLPSHLPATWPRCQMCQQRMAFVGQIYAKEWFSLDGRLAMQVFGCEEHRKTIKYPGTRTAFTISETLHLEFLSPSASRNSRQTGVRCPSQPKLFIGYEQIADSLDQETFQRRRLTEQELPDKHLRADKIGGLFPHDGYDGPMITRQNVLLAQFHWAGIGGTVYLYQSKRDGIYAFRSW